VVGGTSIKDIVKRCFQQVFAKGIACCFVYQGEFNTRKRVFEKMKLKEVIFAAVTLHADELKVERPTGAAIKAACQTYFKNVADSRADRQQRAAAKQATAA